ncbi:MAG: hypothetical protein HYZ53_27690 [Planctomycetes bacterium]|nr:hypothetical protein [Planctomycetota bacterium]
MEDSCRIHENELSQVRTPASSFRQDNRIYGLRYRKILLILSKKINDPNKG